MIDMEAVRKGGIKEGDLHGHAVVPSCWFVEQQPSGCCVKARGM